MLNRLIQEIPLFLTIMLVIISFVRRGNNRFNPYGLYLLVSLLVMETLIIAIKCIGMNYGLPAWKRGGCMKDISAKLFIRGSMPSAHIATIAYLSVTLLAEYPFVGLGLTLLQIKVQIEDNCHTPEQVMVGLFFGFIFGLLTVYVGKTILKITDDIK